jgi:pyrroline-5-carboxylate reductase
MSDPEEMKWIADCMKEGPQSEIERALLEEFLSRRGLTLAELNKLPAEQVKSLMTEACQYASLKLAQLESKAGFREKIRGPS